MAGRLLSERYLQIKNNIPNAISLTNLLLGYLSVVLVLQGHSRMAGIIILWSMLIDAMDGKIARKLGIESCIGKQLDSLSDLISFGVAPAFLVYYSFMGQIGIIGFAVSALFPIAGAIRLAKFNVLPSKAYFSGLPITIAGGTLAAIAITPGISTSLIPFAPLILAFLMVSNVPYSKKIKPLYIKGRDYSFTLAGLTVITALLLQLINVFLTILLIYIASGILTSLTSLKSK